MNNAIMEMTDYIIIGSASRSNLESHINMQRFAEAFDKVRVMPKVKLASPCTGYYKEDQACSATYEQSIVIACNGVDTLGSILMLFCEEYQQDYVLVWERKTKRVYLRNIKDGLVDCIGVEGLMVLMDSDKEPCCFTIDSSGNKWGVL